MSFRAKKATLPPAPPQKQTSFFGNLTSMPAPPQKQTSLFENLTSIGGTATRQEMLAKAMMAESEVRQKWAERKIDFKNLEEAEEAEAAEVAKVKVDTMVKNAMEEILDKMPLRKNEKRLEEKLREKAKNVLKVMDDTSARITFSAMPPGAVRGVATAFGNLLVDSDVGILLKSTNDYFKINYSGVETLIGELRNQFYNSIYPTEIYLKLDRWVKDPKIWLFLKIVIENERLTVSGNVAGKEINATYKYYRSAPPSVEIMRLVKQSGAKPTDTFSLSDKHRPLEFPA